MKDNDVPVKEVLTAWSREALQWDEFVEDVKTGEALLDADERPDLKPPQDILPAWLGYPGATEAQITQAEACLGTTFPPSYRRFLSVSNGWRGLTIHVDHLFSTEEVEWFREREPDTIDIMLGYPDRCTDEDYLAYNDNNEAVHDCYRSQYLRTALQISTRKWGLGDVWLLNPQVVTSEGEWEAWHDTGREYRPFRYRSFWDMVRVECDRHRRYVAERRRQSSSETST